MGVWLAAGVTAHGSGEGRRSGGRDWLHASLWRRWQRWAAGDGGVGAGSGDG